MAYVNRPVHTQIAGQGSVPSYVDYIGGNGRSSGFGMFVDGQDFSNNTGYGRDHDFGREQEQSGSNFGMGGEGSGYDFPSSI